MEEAAERSGSPFSRARAWAIADADKIQNKADTAKCPPIAAVKGFVGGAFNSAFEVVIKAFGQEELEPSALAILFMKIDECRQRVESLPDKTWAEIRPTTPGYAFSGYTGQSGLQILTVVTRAVYSALMITFGYSKSHDRFPKDIEDMPISGPNMTAQFREWPRRAAKELSTRTVAPAPVWDIRSQAGKVWSVFLDECERAEKQLLELESMTWLTLIVFSHGATRSWVEHPRYRERATALESRLREAARSAGIVGPDADTHAIYRRLVDILMVRRGMTASSADQLAVADAIALLESGALATPSRSRPTGTTEESYLPELPTPTERRVFEVIRASRTAVKGSVIASTLKLDESSVYRACGYLTARNAIENLGGGRGYIPLVESLPD